MTTAAPLDPLLAVRGAPREAGVVDLIVRRPGAGEREVLDEVELSEAEGLVGDDWVRRPSRHTDDGSPDPLRQLAVMSSRAAQLLAGDRSRWPLAGDQLYVDLDISHDNLPPGTRLAVGDAVIEVTEPPHTGCAKFTQRFGLEATRLVNSPDGRALRLRGLNARVVVAGTVRVGDAVRRVD